MGALELTVAASVSISHRQDLWPAVVMLVVFTHRHYLGNEMRVRVTQVGRWDGVHLSLLGCLGIPKNTLCGGKRVENGTLHFVVSSWAKGGQRSKCIHRTR